MLVDAGKNFHHIGLFLKFGLKLRIRAIELNIVSNIWLLPDINFLFSGVDVYILRERMYFYDYLKSRIIYLTLNVLISVEFYRFEKIRGLNASTGFYFNKGCE